MNNNQLLRFTTAGSVDDGKSTLIGRLLYDSKSLFDDQLDSIEKASRKNGNDNIDLALFTDGLKSEREQGITIDVAYRYFTTPKRKFILADSPGHFEYTRNMVTAASTANAIVVLIDARHGVLEQTKRHSFIASLLHIPHVIVCINKMDLVDYSEKIFNEIVEQFESFCSKLLITDIRFIPICAKDGDNVVKRSEKLHWYQGAPLLHTLETIHVGSDINKVDARMPIQTILKLSPKQENQSHGFAGRISSGIFRKGDQVTVLPSGNTSTIKSINAAEIELIEAFAPMSISITLEHTLDFERGNMIVKSNNKPIVTKELDVMLCWLNPQNADQQSKYLIRHTSNELSGMITEVVYKFDINTLKRQEEHKQLELNDIARVKLSLNHPIMVDAYRTNRTTGSIIIVNQETNETVAAGMII